MTKLLNAAIAAAAVAYLDAKHGLGNDVHLGRANSAANMNFKWRLARGRASMYSLFEDSVKRQPDDAMYIYERQTTTWKQGEQIVYGIANFLLSEGLKPGDRIAVFMGNCAMYPLIWLACLCVNVVPAFINNGLNGPGLVHCVNVSKAQLVIYEPSLEGALREVQDQLTSNGVLKKFVCLDDGVSEKSGAHSIDLPRAIYFGPAQLAAQSVKAPPASLRDGIDSSSVAVLIFTSGTTGLPKAALCSHGRVGAAMAMWPRVNGFNSKDRIYTPMPLYHSSAAFLCIGASWYAGSTVVIGRKFSASRYWAEVRENDATVIQYIGEIARYLLAVPPHPDDKNHRVRMAYGNGMRPDVWQRFRERFGVKVISEFYASSEGNGALLNYNTGPFGAGAIGRLGAVARRARPDYKIVRVDAITEDIERDPKTGLCIPCQPGETGEFLMRINKDPTGAFMGYADNPEATKKKILANVFEKGDAFFRSGDLMSMDLDGHFWFGDRIGDTFRWRSENVSTAEVQTALGEVCDEANVYGVLVPNHDGRAGCAAIPKDVAAKTSFATLAVHARKRLPKYAVPIFLRIVPAAESTGTVKQLKVALRNEGIEHSKVGSDPLFWLPPNANEYVPFRPEDHAAIVAGQVKL